MIIFYWEIVTFLYIESHEFLLKMMTLCWKMMTFCWQMTYKWSINKWSINRWWFTAMLFVPGSHRSVIPWTHFNGAGKLAPLVGLFPCIFRVSDAFISLWAEWNKYILKQIYITLCYVETNIHYVISHYVETNIDIILKQIRRQSRVRCWQTKPQSRWYCYNINTFFYWKSYFSVVFSRLFLHFQ